MEKAAIIPILTAIGDGIGVLQARVLGCLLPDQRGVGIRDRFIAIVSVRRSKAGVLCVLAIKRLTRGGAGHLVARKVKARILHCVDQSIAWHLCHAAVG